MDVYKTLGTQSLSRRTLKLAATALTLSALPLFGSSQAVADENAAAVTESEQSPLPTLSHTERLKVSAPNGAFPEDLAAAKLKREGAAKNDVDQRLSSPLQYAWAAPVVCHRPLYFQDSDLERYGHDHGIFQPAVSAADFFGRLAVVPYMIGETPCHSCVSSRGYCRPGDCVPPREPQPKELSPRGVIYQAIAVTGGIFVIP
ncbi:MAG: hypothetical protein KDA89_20125 [Planctomycetaceae bacterium]|nr:hypothetical protein [Planctomycetaceae bacterium]